MLPPDLQRIEHIRDYCLDIEDAMTRFGNSVEDFHNDTDYQYVISFCILQIGELCGRLSPELREQSADRIPWNRIRGMRNIVAHDYGSVDHNLIWQTISTGIPDLKNYCEEQLSGWEDRNK